MELGQLAEDVSELKSQHAGIAATCRGMALRIKRMDKVIYGNGRPGLLEQVARTQQSVKVLTWVAGTVGGAVIAALVAVFFQLASRPLV